MVADLDRETIERLEALLARHRHRRWVAGQDRGDGTAQVYSPNDGPMRVVVPICETTAEDAALIAESRNALPALLSAARAWLSLVELTRRQPSVAVGDAVEAVAGGKEQRNG